MAPSPNNVKEFLSQSDMLRKIISSQYDYLVIERMNGVVGGSNRDFESTQNFIVKSLRVYRNGVRQFEGVDYAIVNTKRIQFNDIPIVDDIVICEYIRQNV